MKIIAVIPARMGSTRFPGKPLAMILGRPMIEHVYRRTAMAAHVSQTFIATCDPEIKEATEAFGGEAIMTSPSHERASDRVAEAVQDLAADVIVMVQGDEPMVYPEMIDAAVEPFRQQEHGIVCVNLTARIHNEDEFTDPNCIKVVMDHRGLARYMSREPIPTRQNKAFKDIAAYKQVCIIPFSRSGLALFTRLAPTPLEEAESIDMLRFIEHGHDVKMIPTTIATHAVDTLEDLKHVESLMRQDPLTARYIETI